MIEWPPKPTVVEPAKLQGTVAAIVKVLPLLRSSTPRDASVVDDAKTRGPKSLMILRERCSRYLRTCGNWG
jgi:hypothetical protein